MPYCTRNGFNDKLVRTAFRGARCQAFQKGKFKDVTYLDVNSLYPYIMATMRFPNLQTETLEKDINLDKIGLVKCTMKVPECEIGILPVRYQKRLYFPNKRMKLTSIWTTNEISTALQHGYKIENVKYQISYRDGLNPFSKYIFKLYELKKNSNAETRMAVKLILNSLFGKFAQKPSKKEMKFIERREVPEYHGWKINGTLGNKYLITREIEGKRKYFVHPMISTLITANARLYLLNYIGIIDKKDLLYCDTDSIIMRNFEKYKDRFNVSDQLGAWKIVSDKTEIDIKGRKQYMIGNQVKMSGIHKENATMEAFNKGIMTRNRINTFLSTNDMTQAGKFVTEEVEIGKERDGIPDDIKEIEDL